MRCNKKSNEVPSASYKLPNIDQAYIKVLSSIKSVKTTDQLSSVKRLASNFLRLYGRIGDDAASVFHKFIENKKLELNA